jgi:MFS family permease
MSDSSPQSHRAPLGAGFWHLWSSSSLSNLADGLFKVGLPLVALTVTRSPALIAGVTTALTVPWLLFALPAGALVDRIDRRKVMLCANAARALILAVLAVVTAMDAASIWVIYVVAVGAGIAEVLYDTAAQSILPQIVPREHLTRANGRLYAAELTANEFIGPPLGGVLVTIGAVIAFTAPAGLWLLAAGALLLLEGTFRVIPHTTTAIGTDIVDGLRFLWRNEVLRTLTIMTGVFNLASSATMAIFVVYAVGATSAMGLTASQYGLLLTATAAGSVAGTFVAGTIERRLGRSRAMAAGLAAAALFVGSPAFSTNPIVIATGFFLGGAGIVVWNVISVSLRQRITPEAMLGRITGGHRLFGWGSKPIGATLGGLLAELLGLAVVFVVMALVVLGLLALMRHLTDTALRSAEKGDPLR